MLDLKVYRGSSFNFGDRDINNCNEDKQERVYKHESIFKSKEDAYDLQNRTSITNKKSNQSIKEDVEINYESD